ncbi:MAG: NAD(P)/FAD-dependent oxidoreductase [Candidatus Hodarchaeaceae archaeon]|nr:NAD(P)/FAD-dependent oxidoreductase [Candidatus Hodarchaeaceae archaeon]
MVDALIIGAGPAGLFAAHELSKNSKLSVTIVDWGQEIEKRTCPAFETGKCIGCKPCHIMCGLGGAGGMSSGILNLRYDIGGDLSKLTKSVPKAEKLVKEVDDIFVEHGAPNEVYGMDSEGIEELTRRAAAAGIKFIPIPQRHIGSEYLSDVINSLRRTLESRGVKFLFNSRVERVGKGEVVINGKKIKTKYLLVAPGRVGADWFAEQVKALGVKLTHGPIDIGVRVEVPAVVYEPVVKVNYDPKFHIRTKTFDDFVRTFCTNSQGFVMEERYDDHVGVNGQSLRAKKSQNTNFAFLVHIELTQPVTDTTAYGQSIAYLATTIGGGRPLLQRLGDLRAGRRSTWERIERGHVVPTLKSVTPGDISMALPGRVVTDILEGLDRLDKVAPGVASDSTLLYAPEVKLYAMQINVGQNMETNVPNLFVAGDGAGLSRGIVTAAATGLLAARGIIEKAAA